MLANVAGGQDWEGKYKSAFEREENDWSSLCGAVE